MDKQREIKFQRVYEGFMDENKGQINMREWGPLQSDASFIGPSYLSGYRFVCDRQYTGLKDKNGKEIYEGDIIVQDRYPFFESGKSNYVGVVEWVFSQWQYVLRVVAKDKRGISDGINCSMNDTGFEEGEKTDFEVIGNIYQHENLLNENKNEK